MGLLPFVEECPMDPLRSARTLAWLLALALPASLSLAQAGADPSEGGDAPSPPSIFALQPGAQVGDADVARVTSMLEGSWKTERPAGERAREEAGGGEDVDTRAMWMHMQPFESAQLGRAIYVEVHPDGTPWEPVRQSIFRVYRFGERLRLRVYEFREASRPEVLTNLWLAGDRMPADLIRADELIAVMDLELERASGGYGGETAGPYPTPELGAIEMTASMTIRPDELVTVETFYGLDAQPLPAPELRWTRAQLPVSVDVGEDGLVVITYNEGGSDGPPTVEGDMMFIHYDAWRADGFKFDSTWDRGLAQRTTYPLRQTVTGFKRGLDPVFQGVRRKLIVPPELGYGEAEFRGIPPGSTLVFHVHVLRVEPVGPMPMEERQRRHEDP